MCSSVCVSKADLNEELNTDRRLIGNYSDQLLSLVFVLSFGNLTYLKTSAWALQIYNGYFFLRSRLSADQFIVKIMIAANQFFWGGGGQLPKPESPSQFVTINPNLVPPLSSHFIVLKSHCPVTTLHYVSLCLLSINCCAHNGTRISARIWSEILRRLCLLEQKLISSSV